MHSRPATLQSILESLGRVTCSAMQCNQGMLHFPRCMLVICKAAQCVAMPTQARHISRPPLCNGILGICMLMQFPSLSYQHRLLDHSKTTCMPRNGATGAGKPGTCDLRRFSTKHQACDNHTSCRRLAVAHRVIADGKLEEVLGIAYKSSSLGLCTHTRFTCRR